MSCYEIVFSLFVRQQRMREVKEEGGKERNSHDVTNDASS